MWPYSLGDSVGDCQDGGGTEGDWGWEGGHLEGGELENAGTREIEAWTEGIDVEETADPVVEREGAAAEPNEAQIDNPAHKLKPATATDKLIPGVKIEQGGSQESGAEERPWGAQYASWCWGGGALGQGEGEGEGVAERGGQVCGNWEG